MKATYNITDNRLKIWFDERLPEDEYKNVKSLGLQWFPKQGCFSGVWTPGREDFIYSYGLEITADEAPDDLAGRIERYQTYAENDEKTAEYAQERMNTANTDRQFRMAENTAEKKLDEARYWHDRIAGAIRRAEYRDKPDVIGRRIKKLETDKRRQEKKANESKKWLEHWQNIPLKKKSGEYATMHESAVFLANHDPGHFSMCFTKDKYPKSTYEGARSIWSALTDDVIDPENAQKIMISAHMRKIKHTDRWIKHINMRLEYETAYLEAVGGSLDILKPKPRRKSVAPADGLQKGDIVNCPYGGRGYQKAEILNLYAKSARVKFLNLPDVNERYPKGYQVGRYFIKGIEK